MKTIIYLLIGLLLLLIIGCNDEFEKIEDTKSNDISSLISSVNPSTVELEAMSAPIGSTIASSVFSWSIDRKPQCISLLGWCGRTFKWPWEAIDAPHVVSCDEDCREVVFQIAWDSNNIVHSATFLLLGDISNFPSNEQEFWIDDTYTFQFDGNPLDSISIPSQTISRDPNLGTYGGYIIELNGIINP
jgi:hypothetical protein